MADLKIRIKHHPTGSLARRVLFICILLLVLPLFLYSFYRYIEDYKQNLRDWENYLRGVARERAYFVEEMIKMDQAFLQHYTPPASNVKPLYMGPAIERIQVPRGMAESFVMASRSRQALLIGKKEAEGSALVIALPFSEMLADVETVPPVQVALLDDTGKLLVENRKFKDSARLLKVILPIQDTIYSLQFAIDPEGLRQLQLSSYILHFAVLLFLVGFVGGAAVYLFTRRVAKPLQNLVSTMDRISKGASHARYTPDRIGFEINQLGLQFNETLDSLLQHEQEIQRERIAREKLAEEWKIGHEIQASLLTAHVPGLDGIDIGTSYFASKEVNGDFYDLFRMENGHLLLAVCDTAGKGISACLFSLGLRSMIRSMASSVDDLAEIVKRTNDLYMLDAHETSMFSTLWIGILDPVNLHLTYCSQGHPPAILCHRSELKELWTEGIALGAQKMDVIATKQVTLQKGDVLILYTDGIIEAHDPDQQLFGKNRLREFIQRKRKELAGQIADQIINEVHLFSRGAPQHDDMTLVVLRISD